MIVLRYSADVGVADGADESSMTDGIAHRLGSCWCSKRNEVSVAQLLKPTSRVRFTLYRASPCVALDGDCLQLQERRSVRMRWSVAYVLCPVNFQLLKLETCRACNSRTTAQTQAVYWSVSLATEYSIKHLIGVGVRKMDILDER